MNRIKGAVTWAVDRYLGNFVSDIDPEQLKMDLWRGHVELTSLQLKPDLLQAKTPPTHICTPQLRPSKLTDVVTDPTHVAGRWAAVTYGRLCREGFSECDARHRCCQGCG